MKRVLGGVLGAGALVALGFVLAGLWEWLPRGQGTTTISSTVTFNRGGTVSLSETQIQVEANEVLAGAVLHAGPINGAPQNLSDIDGLQGQWAMTATHIGQRQGSFPATSLPDRGADDYAIALVVSYWEPYLVFSSRMSSEVRVFFKESPADGMTIDLLRGDFAVIDSR
jgi:hypothetical protein